MTAFLSFCFPADLLAQTITYSTPGTTTWTAPAGVTSIQVQAWGAGGGGGGSNGNTGGSGGG
ncbi:MAG TPA: hypothetical protein VK907_10205, partial [Phnomibacter sp.]|nr:hypothetical protein [Phnomibacter sp.]